MKTCDKRVWVDAHVHIFAEVERDAVWFHVEELLRVLHTDPGHLVWLASLARPDYVRLSHTPADYVRLVNQAQLELQQHMPPGRVFGSVAVHPGAVQASLEAIDRYGGGHGFVQVGEVLGYALGFALDSAEMVSIARHAARLGLPVQCHVSTTGQPDGEQMRQAVHLAQLVPEARVVAAHAIGGGNTWLHITAAEVYANMGGRNLWLEIRDFNRRDFLRAAVERLGANRLIVGTDWIARGKPPYPPYGILFNVPPEEMPYPSSSYSLEGFLREAGCGDVEVARIAAENAAELFRLPLDQNLSTTGLQ
ncbi:MAG: amidohydrolase family protein [Armatimonadota bacterium]|nr:amidohydrolase family protein [Armatimonadota bacterium]